MEKIKILFDKMTNDKKVRITKEFRLKLNIDNIGQWFSILSVNCDNTVNLCGEYHTILQKVSVDKILFNN